MLSIEERFSGVTATNPERGDTNRFLEHVLVEVVAENYRQTAFEVISLAENISEDTRGLIDPPLRANERVLSGLFATAISRAAPRSRTEVRIDRGEIEDAIASFDDYSDDDTGDHTEAYKQKAGRVDYLAWYANRTFAIELKMGAMNCENPVLTESIKKRWEVAVQQAQGAQEYLRAREKGDRNRYPNPISLAMMVVVGRRAITWEQAEKDDVPKVSESGASFVKVLGKLKPKPSFLALYTFPNEFRYLVPRKKGQPVLKNAKVTYVPFVAFLSRSFVNAKRA